MKIALFGGTFNPIHNGHINLIRTADEKYNFDMIIIMPDKIPPHKEAVDLADEKQRLEMCRLAFEDERKYIVSDYEFSLKGKSYSINTIRYLLSKYSNSELYLIIGSDMFITFDTWKEYREILKLVRIIAAARNENDIISMNKYAQEHTEMNGRYDILSIEPYVASSTEIRKLICNNKDYSCYLPHKVVKYILENNLYR